MENPRLKTNTDGSVTVELRYPVKTPDENETKQLTIRRLKGKQLRSVTMTQLDHGDHMLKLIQQLADVPPFVCDQLDAEDYAEISAVVMGFFGNVRPAGGR